MTAPYAAALAHQELKQSSVPSKRLLSRGDVDAIIALVLYLLCFALAFTHLENVGLGNSAQSAFTPALDWACTGKFDPVDTDDPKFPALGDFISGKTQSFQCKDLPLAPKDRIPFVPLHYQTLYLIAATAAVWSITGVTWSALHLVAAVLAGLMGAAVYGICRLFVAPAWAAATTVLSMFSPLNATMLPEVRDYSKAPFILGVILLSGLLVKTVGKPKQFVAIALLAGIVVGVGFGIRVDLAAAIPFVALVLLLVLVSTRLRVWRQVLIAGGVFLIGFAAAAAPVLSAYRGGSIIGHVALLGLTTYFNAPLGVSTMPYDVGVIYNDEAVSMFVEEYALGRQDEPGARPNLDAPVGPIYSGYALGALVSYGLHFPADIAIRSYAAALRTIEVNFDGNRWTNVPDLFYRVRDHLVWHAAAPLLLFLFIAFVASSSIRLAVFLLISFAYFDFLGALQFQLRHVFYLEFWYWLALVGMVAYLLQFLFRLACGKLALLGSTKAAVIALAVPATALAACLLMLLALRAFQTVELHQLFTRYMTVSRATVQLTEERSGDNILLRPRGRIPAMSGVLADFENTPLEGYYFDASIDTQRCPSFAAKVVFTKNLFGTDLSRVMEVASNASGTGHFLFPVVNWPLLHTAFVGFEVAEQQRACFLGLQAVVDYKSLPLPLWLQLPPDWRNMKLYQYQTW